MISSAPIAIIWVSDVLEWLRSERFAPLSTGLLESHGSLERWGLLGCLSVFENMLAGYLGSDHTLSFCALALPLLPCDKMSYHGPTTTAQSD